MEKQLLIQLTMLNHTHASPRVYLPVTLTGRTEGSAFEIHVNDATSGGEIGWVNRWDLLMKVQHGIGAADPSIIDAQLQAAKIQL